MAINPVAAGPPVRAGLVDAIDHLLNRGAVLSGDATLSVAGVDLVYVGLNLLIASVETLQEHGDWLGDAVPLPSGPRPAPSAPAATAGSEGDLAAGWSPSGEAGAGLEGAPAGLSLSAADGPAPAPVLTEGPDAAPEGAERALARLVLTLVELLRQLVERQALRRMEGSSLTEEQIERMGRGLMELAEKMAELRTLFGLEESDLRIDLGPLGRLL